MLQKKLLISSWFGTIGTSLKSVLAIFFIFLLIYQFINHSETWSIRTTIIIFICFWFELWFAIIIVGLSFCLIKNWIRNWQFVGKIMILLSLISFLLWTIIGLIMNNHDSNNLKTVMLMISISTVTLISGCILWLTKNKNNIVMA